MVDQTKNCLKQTFNKVVQIFHHCVSHLRLAMSQVDGIRKGKIHENSRLTLDVARPVFDKK